MSKSNASHSPITEQLPVTIMSRSAVVTLDESRVTWRPSIKLSDLAGAFNVCYRSNECD